jgi:predicted nucleic acid-binding protein
MKPILLDSAGLTALWNRTDQWHGPAKKALDELIEAEPEFISASPILIECGNAAARQPFRQQSHFITITSGSQRIADISHK